MDMLDLACRGRREVQNENTIIDRAVSVISLITVSFVKVVNFTHSRPASISPINSVLMLLPSVQ